MGLCVPGAAVGSARLKAHAVDLNHYRFRSVWRLMRSLALIARPFFQLNHAVMMRHGQRRLPAYLAGYQAGAQSPG